MSAYSNYVQDFPWRCNQLLEHFLPRAEEEIGREVTLMLAVATAGLLVPFERLRKSSNRHPSGDRQRFNEATQQLGTLLTKPFLSSELWKGPADRWSFAEKVQDLKCPAPDWREVTNPENLSTEATVDDVLSHIRNSLAHGNIYTTGNPIELLIFLSRVYEEKGGKYVPTDDFSMLAVSPLDFHAFLRKWFCFLDKLRIPEEVCQLTRVA